MRSASRPTGISSRGFDIGAAPLDRAWKFGGRLGACVGDAHPERLAIYIPAGLGDAGDEGEQQPAVRNLVELGELLGERELVAAKRHNVGTKAEADRALRA
ncbi:MAG TPA: hypothetical protein VIH85_09410 [Solirubrobacteraceae bacterium]